MENDLKTIPIGITVEKPLNQELDYSVVNRDTEQVLVDWE